MGASDSNENGTYVVVPEDEGIDNNTFVIATPAVEKSAECGKYCRCTACAEASALTCVFDEKYGVAPAKCTSPVAACSFIELKPNKAMSADAEDQKAGRRERKKDKRGGESSGSRSQGS